MALSRGRDARIVAQGGDRPCRYRRVSSAYVDVRGAETARDQRRDHRERVVDDQRRCQCGDVRRQRLGVRRREADVAARNRNRRRVRSRERKAPKRSQGSPPARVTSGAKRTSVMTCVGCPRRASPAINGSSRCRCPRSGMHTTTIGDAPIAVDDQRDAGELRSASARSRRRSASTQRAIVVLRGHAGQAPAVWKSTAVAVFAGLQ